MFGFDQPQCVNESMHSFVYAHIYHILTRFSSAMQIVMALQFHNKVTYMYNLFNFMNYKCSLGVCSEAEINVSFYQFR